MEAMSGAQQQAERSAATSSGPSSPPSSSHPAAPFEIDKSDGPGKWRVVSNVNRAVNALSQAVQPNELSSPSLDEQPLPAHEDEIPPKTLPEPTAGEASPPRELKPTPEPAGAGAGARAAGARGAGVPSGDIRARTTLSCDGASG
jgi:hypothetical protein